MFSQQNLDSIKSSTEAQKDSAIIKLCSQRSQGRGRAQGRSRPSSRRGTGRGFVPQFQQQTSYDRPRGRGHGRSSRGRGNYQQPFPKNQGKQTSV